MYNDQKPAGCEKMMPQISLKIPKLFGSIYWTLFLAFLFFLVCLTFLLRFLSPARDVQPSVPLESSAPIISADFSATTIIFDNVDTSLPAHLPIYKVVSKETTIDELGRFFGLRATRDPEIWTDTSGHKSLALDSIGNVFRFSSSVFEGDFDGSQVLLVQKSKAISKAKEILTKVGVGGYEPQVDRLEFLIKGESHFDTSEEGKANVVSIPFAPSTPTYPVFVGKSLNAPITITIDSANQLVQYTQYKTLISIQSERQVQTIKRSDIETLLKTQRSRVIRVLSDTQQTVDLAEAETITLKTAPLEYRVLDGTTSLLPYFHFEAEALMRETKETVILEILLPAIKTTTQD